MPAWQWVVDIAAVVLLASLLYGVLLVIRRRVLSRDGGTFEMGVRLRGGEGGAGSGNDRGRGWALGIGRYQGSRLEWFRIFTLSVRPRASWQRNDLSYLGRREPVGGERDALYAGQLVVRLETRKGPVDMAMSEASLTGLQAWLEAGPPGQKAGKGG